METYDICDDCGCTGYIQWETIWTSGDCLKEWKTRKMLCDTCSQKYVICEECGVLIDDNVALPKGDIRCPDCRHGQTTP